MVDSVTQYSALATSNPFATRASVPGAGSTPNIYISSMTVTWGDGSPANPTGTTYIIERAVLSSFSPVAESQTTTNAQYTFTSLNPGTVYFFRVKAANIAGVETVYNTSWSDWTQFSPPGPGSPPLNGITSNSMTANWTNGSPPNPASTDYVCAIATSAGGSPINSVTTQNFSTTFSNLIQNSTYYVQVKAGATNPLSGLVGYWKFDEGSGVAANDFSGYSNNGTLTNGPLWTTGKIGSSLSFDGVNDYVDVGNPASLQLTGAMTISAWVKLNTNAAHVIVAKFSASRGYELNTNPGSANPSLVFWTAPNSSSLQSSGSVEIQSGVWHHVAGVYIPATAMQLYVDGIIASSNTTSISATQYSASNNVRIGMRSDGIQPTFGSIDDVRIYNGALSATEVSGLYNFNGALGSSYTSLGSAKTSASPPSSFQLTGIFQSSASFSWTGGLGSNGYRVEAATSSSFSTISRSSTTTPNELGNYVTGLNANTLYYFRVGNLNLDGVGTFPAGLISTATLAMIPGSGLITDRSGISLTATWGANSNPLGTSYVLEASTYSNFSFIHQSTMVYATTGTVSGLSPNTVYYMQVKARNIYGNETGYTNLGSTTTMLAPPANTQFSGIWYSSATLSWNPMTANGYVLDWSLYPDFSVTTSSTSTQPDITSLTATGLDINATYYFKVGSKNALNEISYTAVMTTATLANQPMAQSLSGVGPTTITASWSNNNNPPGTSYQAQASTTSNFSLINQITTPNELGNYTGLTSQTTYYLRVRAVNHSGIPTNWVPLGSTGTIVTILVSTGTYTAPATVLQNNEAAMFKLTLATDGSTVNWNSLTLQQLGTASDADIEEIRIYKDNAPFGTYDGPGVDYGVYVAGARFTSGTGTVYIVGGEPAISATPRDYFVVLKLAGAAQTSKNIQIRLAASGSLGFSPGMWQVQGPFPATSGSTLIQDNSTVVNLTGTNLAPTSISKGTSNTALLKIRAAADTGTADITSLILTRTGTATNGDVSAIKIFKDADSDGVFDPPGSGAPDTQVNTLDASGFSGPTELVTFDTAQTVTTFPSNFFVVVDIPVSATTDNTLGVSLAQGSNVIFSGGTDSANGPFPLDSVPLTITDVPNTLTATITDYPAPATGTQGDKIGMLKFSLAVNAGFARWRGLRVDLTGSEISSDVKEAQVYWDADTSGAFSAGDGLPIATATFQGGLTNLAFSTQTIASTPATYFLVYHINPAAIPGNTLTAKIFDATYLTITTPNTTVSGSFPLNSGTVSIQPTLDTVTVMPGSPQPAPASVVQGDNNVSLAKLRMSLNANAATFTGLRLDKTGGCVDGDVSAIKIWRDANTSGILESNQDELISSGLDTFFNGLANVTLNIPQNIPLTPSYQDYFVSMSFSPSATYGVNCGLNLATSNYVMLASPDRVADSNFPMSAQTTINEYPDTIYIATTSIAPSAADPGTPNVPLLKLAMNTGFSGAPWRSVQFDRTGTATSSDLGLIKLWLDRNANGTLDVVQDAPTLVSTAFPAGSGPVVLNINPNETLNVSSKTYFVTADITAGATPNRQFGLLTVNNNYFLTQSPNTISTTTTTGYPAFPFQSGSVTINEPPSEVTAIPISLAPSEVTQDFQNVPFMYLSLRTNNYTAYWTTLKLDRIGFGTDGDISRIRLYADDGDGSFEPTTQDTLVQTGNILVNNNQATLSFSPISITKTDKKFFVTLDISPVAGAGNNIGLRMGNSLYLGFQAPDFAGPITFETNQTLIQPTVDTLSVTVEPIPTTLRQGDSNKAVAKISLRADSHAVAWKGLMVARLGSLPGSGVAAISIWRDTGSGTLDDSDILIGSAQQPFTSSPSPQPSPLQGEGDSGIATVTLNAPETIITSSQLYFLAVSVDRVLATAGETFGLALPDSGVYIVTEPDLVTASVWQSDLMIVNDYPDILTLKPTNIDLEGIYQGQEQALAKFDFNLNEDTAELLTFKIKKTGTISDTQITGARLYLDSNSNSAWDKNTDTLISGPVTLSNGLANFAFSPSFGLAAATSTIFLTYAATSDATVGKTIGYNIPDTTYIVLQGTDSVATLNIPYSGTLIPVKDARVPTKPKIAVDNVYTNEPTRLHFHWNSSVFTGEIQEAEYAIGSSSASTDIRDWTKISKSTDTAVSGLALEHGKTYYIKIMTKSDSGFYSDSGVSIGITVDTMKPVMAIPPQIVLDKGDILASWSQAIAGPSGIVGYKIEERNAKTAVWNVITSTTAQAQKTEDRRPKTEDRGPKSEDRRPMTDDRYRTSDFGPLLSAPLITGNSYFVGSKPPGTYYYRVIAVNGAGTEGAPSPVTRVVVGPAPDAVVSEALCYPNPFDSRRTSANIVYTLNQDTDTEVKIYDIFGRKAWANTYAQGQEGGRLGANTVTWDGVDSEGAKVSFGAYLCEIKPKAGGETEVKIAVIH